MLKVKQGGDRDTSGDDDWIVNGVKGTKPFSVDSNGNRIDAEGYRVDADGYRIDADGNRIDSDGNKIDSDRTRDGRKGKGKGTKINVKEKVDGPLGSAEILGPDSRGRRRQGGTGGENGVNFMDSGSDWDAEKMSDRDSGMEDEEDVDVLLTDDQRQMIVNMLFDENGDIRPQFYRNEDGQIVVTLCVNVNIIMW